MNLDILKQNIISLVDGESFCIAVSGGADSMFLAYFSKQIGLDFTALIVDHKLRVNSTIEAQQTQDRLQKYGINSEILTWQHAEIISGIEEKARNMRYELLTAKCREMGVRKLLLAHHGDDQIETFFLNAGRGSGLVGLCAMPEVFIRDDVAIIRPLLAIVKSDIVEYLIQNNVPWVEDPSNKDDKFTRNKLRNVLAKASNLPTQQDNRLLKTIKTLQGDLQIVQKSIQATIRQICNISEDKCIIGYGNFIALLPSEQYYVMHYIITMRSGGKHIRSSSINILINNIIRHCSGKQSLNFCHITWDNTNITYTY
jgi:tRNA(Ile)-lysidine synthase